MTPLFEAALELQDFFIRRQWQFCLIGGIALLRWGEPRFTRHVDVTLLTGFGREDEFITPILSSGYRGRIPDAAEFARRNRVLLVDSPHGVPIDIALAGLPFEALLVQGQRGDPPHHDPEPPRQTTLGQHQPAIAGLLDLCLSKIPSSPTATERGLWGAEGLPGIRWGWRRGILQAHPTVGGHSVAAAGRFVQ